MPTPSDAQTCCKEVRIYLECGGDATKSSCCQKTQVCCHPVGERTFVSSRPASGSGDDVSGVTLLRRK